MTDVTNTHDDDDAPDFSLETDDGAELSDEEKARRAEDEAPVGEEVGFGVNQVNPVTAPVDKIEGAKVDESDAERIRAGQKVNVYNPNTGLGKRVGGPFADELELEEAERRRAIMERRDPDYSDMAGSAGVPLFTAGMMANAFGGGQPAVAQMIEGNADNDKLGPTPVTQVDLVGANVTEEILEVKEQEDRIRQEGNNDVVTSHDNPGVVFAAPVENSGR